MTRLPKGTALALDVPPVLVRAGLRFHLRQPSQLMLTVLGIALGVAVVVAIDLASFSARQAFQISADLLRGRASHQLSAAGGGLREGVYRDLRLELGLTQLAPVLEGSVRLPGAGAESLMLVGVEPLAVRDFGWSFAPAGEAGPALLATLAGPGDVLLPEDLATALGAGIGSTVRLSEPVAGYELTVRSVAAGPTVGVDGAYLISDIATAQEALDRVGWLSRIDLRITSAADLASVTAYAARERLLLEPVDDQAETADAMTRSFRINLQALSLLALLVGAFLVYSTAAFAVIRRRETFGIMRSVGTSRRQVLSLVLTETLALALLGTLLGLLSGIVLGSGLVKLVLRTIDDLYLTAAVDYYGLSALVLLKGFALGIGASLISAAVPAFEAARAPPRVSMNRAALERSRRGRLPVWIAVSVVSGAAGTGLLLITERLEYSFVGIFLVLIAAALLAPVLVYVWSLGIARGAARLRWLALAYAARSIGANLSRTGPAIAALMIAIATFVGIGIMVASFRGSVNDWLTYSFDADVLIGFEDGKAPAGSGARRALLDGVEALPGVAGMTLSRRVEVFGSGAELLAIAPSIERGRWPKLAGERREALADLARGNQVLVSEAFAGKRDLAAGGRVELATPAGRRSFRIAAIFTDYTTDRGLIAIDLATYRKLFADPGLSSIALFAEPGRARELLAAAREFAAARNGMLVTTGAFLRELSLGVFDRTFTITQVLRLIAGLVAVIAVFNSLQAQRLDTARELAVLRAQGATPRDVIWLGELQTGLLGLSAGLLAMPLGLLLAWLLIVVVNRIAFGWSMELLPDVTIMVQGLALGLVAALLAGWWPSRRAVQQLPAAGLRED